MQSAIGPAGVSPHVEPLGLYSTARPASQKTKLRKSKSPNIRRDTCNHIPDTRGRDSRRTRSSSSFISIIVTLIGRKRNHRDFPGSIRPSARSRRTGRRKSPQLPAVGRKRVAEHGSKPPDPSNAERESARFVAGRRRRDGVEALPVPAATARPWFPRNSAGGVRFSQGMRKPRRLGPLGGAGPHVAGRRVFARGRKVHSPRLRPWFSTPKRPVPELKVSACEWGSRKGCVSPRGRMAPAGCARLHRGLAHAADSVKGCVT